MQEVKIIPDEKELIIALSGEIESKNAEEFYEQVMSVFRLSPRDIVFYCGELSFIDSTTLGTFVKILKNTKIANKKMKLKDLQPKIKKLFTICALDTIMEIE